MSFNSTPPISNCNSSSITFPILKPIIGNSQSLFENPLHALYRPSLPSFPISPILREAVDIDGTVNIMLPPLLRPPSIQSEEILPTDTVVLKYPNGERYLGEVKGSKRWGRGIMMNTKGVCLTKENFISEGIYKNDLLNGFGIWHKEKGESYEGMFKDGKSHGYGEIKDRKSKKTLFEGYFECGHRVCGKEYIDNKTFFIGTYDNEENKAYGYLIDIETLKVLYHGSFKNNQPLNVKTLIPSSVTTPLFPPLLPRKHKAIIPEKTRIHTPSISTSSLSSISSSPKIVSRNSPLPKGMKDKISPSLKNIKSHSTSSVKNSSSKPPKMYPMSLSSLIPSTKPSNYSSIFSIENDTITYPNGSVYTGNTLNKKRHGFGCMVNREGARTYQGFYKDDLKEGFGIAMNSDGSKYIGLHSKGLRHGFGEYKNKTQTMTGFFVLDYMTTGKEIILEDESYFIGNYLKSQKQEGVLLDNTEKEILYLGPFVNDKPHGSHISWIRNGVHFKGNCFAGQFQGMAHMKLPDGEEWHGKVTGDLPHGFAKHIDKDGNLIGHVYYERGHLKEGVQGIIRLSENRYYYGPLSGNGANGKGYIKDKEGKRIFYFGEIINGMKQGWGTEYSEDGTAEYTGQFDEDERVETTTVSPYEPNTSMSESNITH